MKGTRHNGRSGKNGVYNPLHNDRRFNPEHSEHIDNERVRQNIYWDCYQGYTTMEDQGKENNFSFEQIELAFYEEHYGNYVMKQNERHVKARHPDRCKEVEDVWKNKKTCPEESIYQLGTIDEHASVETLILVFDEFKKEFDKRFGSNVHIIDWSLHMDEPQRLNLGYAGKREILCRQTGNDKRFPHYRRRHYYLRPRSRVFFPCAAA